MSQLATPSVRSSVSIALTLFFLVSSATRGQEAESDTHDFGLPKLETLPLKPTDDPLLALKQERYRAAKEHYDLLLPRMVIELRLDHLSQAIQRVIDAEHDLSGNEAERIKCLEKSVELYRGVEKTTILLFEHGRIPQGAVPLARYERVMAEIRLLEARQKPPRG